MSLTRAELEEIVANGTGQQQLDAVALLGKLKQKDSVAKPLAFYEADETGCRQVDVWFLSGSFNADPDAAFRKKLFNLARERYPRFAEEFTRLEIERKADAFTWQREHARMLRWAADPTGSLIGITHSVRALEQEGKQ